MTSHRWTPGDKYGGRKRPNYLIISYTWGRWRLKDSELPHVRALAVKGVTWKIPRVNPSHFDALDLGNTIERLPALAAKKGQPDIEYVWVDVACIDQTPNSSEMAAEIGRQAKIFKGAAAAFVWFTRHTVATLSEVLGRMDTWLNDTTVHPKIAKGKEIRHFNDLGIVDAITADPWFTSLWTLQEAFLRQDALLVTRDGRPWPNGGFTWNPDLKSLIALVEPIANQVRFDEHEVTADPQACRQLEKSLYKSGLISLMMENPIVLLSVAQNRKTGPDNTTDRVYGIMQVFNLQLGKSRPGVDPRRKFSLGELEDELGAALMALDPIMSQLFVYERPPPLGEGWRVGPSSRVAYYLDSKVYEEMKNPTNQRVSAARLSTVSVGNTTWGQFDGSMCSLKQVHSVLERLDRGWWSPVSLAIDYSTELRSKPDTAAMLAVMEQLTKDHRDAQVLLLGHCEEEVRGKWTPCHAVGLIMVPYHNKTAGGGTGKWRRIGLCTWSLLWSRYRNEVTKEMKALMTGERDQWFKVKGIFG